MARVCESDVEYDYLTLLDYYQPHHFIYGPRVKFSFDFECHTSMSETLPQLDLPEISFCGSNCICNKCVRKTTYEQRKKAEKLLMSSLSKTTPTQQRLQKKLNKRKHINTF